MPVTKKAAEKVICCRCKKEYGSTTFFYKTNSILFGTSGHLPVCKECLGEIFLKYFKKYNHSKRAMKRLCMAFDLYYDDSIFDTCSDDDISVVLGNYIKRLNMVQYKGKTFDTTLEGDFYFQNKKKAINQTEFVTLPLEKPKEEPVQEVQEKKEVSSRDINKWGDGFEPEDYKALNSHYKYLKDANPNCDSNQEIFIIELCQTNMLKMKALREGAVDDYKKLAETYRKTFEKAGLKTEQDVSNDADSCWGQLVKDISQYTVEEYYRDKLLYKDMDGLDDYYQRHCARPLFNTKFGTQTRDKVYYVHEDEYEEDSDDE